MRGIRVNQKILTSTKDTLLLEITRMPDSSFDMAILESLEIDVDGASSFVDHSTHFETIEECLKYLSIQLDQLEKNGAVSAKE